MHGTFTISLGLNLELERPYAMTDKMTVPVWGCYIGKGGRRGLKRSVWHPLFGLGGWRMREVVQFWDKDAVWCWLRPLIGRAWYCDCGEVDTGGCHGWRLRRVVEFFKTRGGLEEIRVRGEESIASRVHDREGEERKEKTWL